MAGERHPVLPCLHEQRRAALPGNPPQPPGAFGDSGGADAHSSHLGHGESKLLMASEGTGDPLGGDGGWQPDRSGRVVIRSRVASPVCKCVPSWLGLKRRRDVFEWARKKKKWLVF